MKYLAAEYIEFEAESDADAKRICDDNDWDLLDDSLEEALDELIFVLELDKPVVH